MSRIIIEQLSEDPVEFLHENFKTGLPLDISAVKGDLLEEQDLFLDFFDTGDLEFYRWGCIHVGFPDFCYEILYESTRVDYIKVSEEVLFSHQNEITRAQLEHFTFNCDYNEGCKTTPEYINWLIETGRAASLSARTMDYLILYTIIQNNDRAAVERMLRILHLFSPKKTITYINKFLQYEGMPEHYMKIMNNAGLFSHAHGRKCLLSKITSAHMEGYTDEDLSEIWVRAMNPPRGEIIVALNLIANHNSSNLDQINEVVTICRDIDRKTFGEISRYGMCILRLLLFDPSITLRDSQQLLVGKLIFEGIFIPRFWEAECEPSLVIEGVRIILSRTIKSYCERFHEIMYCSPNKDPYVAAANSIINDIIRETDYPPSRLEELIIMLGRDVNINLFLAERITQLEDPIVRRLLKEIEERELSDFLTIAEQLFSKLRDYRWGRTFLDYNHLIGDKTLRMLMFVIMDFDSEHPMFRHLKERVQRYARRHPDEYVSGLIERFLNKEKLWVSLCLRPPIRDAIYKTRRHLILGSRTYAASESQLVDIAIPITIPAKPCIKCHENLGAIVYKIPNDDHGIYYCSGCKSDECKKEDCMVCFTSEKSMCVVTCGHPICEECANHVIAAGQVCPQCRKVFVTTSNVVSIEDATIKFLQEWINDKHQAQERARNLYEEDSVEHSGSEYSDDSD